MIRFLARRALGGAATIAGVVVAVFLLLAAAPGDPARLTLVGQGPLTTPSPSALRAFREMHGLDRPLPSRLAAWSLSAIRRAPVPSTAYTTKKMRRVRSGPPVAESSSAASYSACRQTMTASRGSWSPRYSFLSDPLANGLPEPTAWYSCSSYRPPVTS